MSELNTGLKKRRRASSQIPSPDRSSQDCEKHDHSSEGREITVVMIFQAQCWCVFSTHLHHLVQQMCSDNCVQYFTIFSSSSCLRKKSTHIAKT